MSTEKEVLTEGKILLNALEHQRSKIEDTMDELDKKLQSLSDTNLMLQSTPKKFTEQLKSSIPNMVDDLKSVILEEITRVKDSYSDDINRHISFLEDSEVRIAKVSEDIERIDKKRIKMFFLGVIISSGISVTCATYAASYMIQKFPTRVVIDKPENIILHDSDVSLWGTDNVKVLKGVSSKKNLNNKNGKKK